MSYRNAALGLIAMIVSCGETAVDWSAPENFLLRESSAKKDDGVELSYSSLVDATCSGVFAALADIEHYQDFVPGVDRTQLLSVDGNTKTVQIAQRVIGRQSNAKVAWTVHADKQQIDFKTLQSDLNYNDGHYELEPSPDGQRCLVRSTFVVKHGQGMAQAVPIGVLATGTREAFLGAAKGVKKRATGATG